ncbi:alternative ribosome rescue aminoacyl-tRNA hydrolase ArfB [Rosistilla carotiformis]|uniref:alternative ribosome rescue aminoacyl-tRNA hydrolase ArfB n=1 Tax=Rosistilla carotiformis TaxID=2528017 RepID=UPI0011A97339|nr:alternative ribosome rescue aminoacyl-tRNA hydrolase ArfB [Rosistilla carotiformis]
MKDLIINSRVTIPADQLTVTHARSSGPGGQNVNKVNSKVTVSWQVDDNNILDPEWTRRVQVRHQNRINQLGQLSLTSQQYRQQPRNLEDCLSKLRELLLQCQHPPKRRRETKPTFGSKLRRLETKRQQSSKKQSRGGKWD